MKANYVPSAPIRKLVREYIAGRDMGEPPLDSQRTRPYSAITAVAHEFVLSESALELFAVGARHPHEMPFDLADRMLCKMDMNQLWWSELSDLYYAVELVDPDERTLEIRRKARERYHRHRMRMTPEQLEWRRERKRRFARAKYRKNRASISVA